MKLPLFPLLLCATLLLVVASLPPPGSLDAAFNELEAAGPRQRIIGYERSHFGAGWAVAPGQRCDTRERILRASLEDARVSRAHPCSLASAHGIDPYSGMTIAVGTALSALERAEPIELDHVLPLAAAWDLGAHAWPPEQRVAFANDPLNLVVVSREHNREKSDKLPSEWLPPDRKRRCWYVNRMAQVAAKYDLALPEPDLSVMRRQCLLGYGDWLTHSLKLKGTL